MPNFYEILDVLPISTSDEIGKSIDQKYNHYRRLVTHHDPTIVNQANQILALLEQIRLTLLNPEKREIYDTSIGVVTQQEGGLADPDKFVPTGIGNTGAPVFPIPVARTQAETARPASPSSIQSGAIIQPLNIWECPRCHHPNKVGTQFCKQCGETVGIKCPDCSTISEVSSIFCSNCGVKLETALRRKEITSQIQKDQVELNRVESKSPLQDTKVAEFRLYAAKSLSWLIVAIVGVVCFIQISMGDYLSLTSILVIYGLSVVANWILAGIFRVSLRELSGAGWANFFLLGSQSLNQLLFLSDFGSDLYMPADLFTLAILFLVGLAVTRNLRGLAKSLSEYYKWLIVFIGFSYLVAICLIAYPVILSLAFINSYTYSPDLYQYIYKIMPYTGTLSLGGYTACVTMLFITALIGIRVIGKIQYEVRVAKEDQRQKIERLQNQIALMNRELSNLL